ncbi:Na+/H+ antiporter NhaA [Solirhodobacter olei]|uniref:Na+/H+ antiporter NhaA n=1 Tax=Solirhodobacter olei TaxID=2493082 RepID=UPI000FDC465F|nr:Na+/H+ antiporter NhaA [Solirhodobacter olei]
MPTTSALSRLMKSDAAGGILLLIAAALAMVVANSSLAPTYNHLLDVKLSVLVEGHGLSKPLILWINDGLMAVFFFLIGLELKREMIEGKLKNPRDVVLPGLAAVGGMAVPALIYLAFNANHPATIQGWAIPAATDIAFAVGILALLGKRVPPALKIFLLTLAILDDMGAIIIIALFYTQELHVDFLLMAIVPLALLWWRHERQAHRIAPTILLGTVLWVLVLESGIHPTIAGVITAFFIPLKDRFGKSPLHAVEHGLTPYVYFLIVPIFAFANAGVSLSGLSADDMLSALPLGIAAGLVLGKQIGVFATTWALVKSGAARLPHGVGWRHIWGLSLLAGIGFTMSLFIGSLSFDDALHLNEVRFGVLSGSAISAVLGFLLLRAAPSAAEMEAKHEAPKATAEKTAAAE